MKLRAEGFRRNARNELVGNVIAYSDEDEPLGVEHSGNYSRNAGEGLLKKLTAAGVDPTETNKKLTELIRLLRTNAELPVESTHESTQAELPAQPNRPAIQITDRVMHEIADECWSVIEENNDPPICFQQSGLIVRVIRNSHGYLVIHRLRHAGLKGFIDRLAYFMKSGELGDSPARPPDDVIDDMLAELEMPLPELLGIAHTPIFAPTGKLVSDPGYDPVTAYLLDLPPGLSIPRVSPEPDRAAIDRALQLIFEELLVDFPLVAASDRAHALAAMVLPFVRLLIEAPTPLHLIESPTPGSGKGLLVDVLTIPAAGKGPSVMAECGSEEEWRKRITAVLLNLPQFVLIDNVRSRLDSAALSAVLTASELWEDRVLGHSRTVRLLVNCVWLASANNPSLSLEMARRAVSIRLDAAVERPWERRGFKHPRLKRWAIQHRGELVWAALTLIQAWVAAGMPAGSRSLGSYENWSEVMGGILDVAGVPGFLGNMERVYAEADREVSDWAEFMDAWWQEFQDRRVATDLLFGLAVRRKLLPELWGGRDDRAARIRFGKALSRTRDRVISGFRIVRAARDDHAKVQTYRLERLKQAPTDEPPADSAGSGGMFSDPEKLHEQKEGPADAESLRGELKTGDETSTPPQLPATARTTRTTRIDPWEEFLEEGVNEDETG